MTTLERVRAEIEQIIPSELPYGKNTPENIRDMALEIIDKYARQEKGEQKKGIKDTEFYKMCKMCGDSITATLTTNEGRTISFKGSKIDEALEQMKGEQNA